MVRGLGTASERCADKGVRVRPWFWFDNSFPRAKAQVERQNAELLKRELLALKQAPGGSREDEWGIDACVM